METVSIDKDITVFYITAASFPDGVLDAHRTLHSKIPFTTARRYFGLSRPEPEKNGEIVYRAAAEEIHPGEGAAHGCQTMVIRKGRYHSISLKNYAEDITSISRAFDEILALPDIDPNGYCVEWYTNDKDMQCIVRIAG